MNFYPEHAPVPAGIRSDSYMLRPLRASDNELDYAAVMDTGAFLRIGTLGRWPTPDFSLKENLGDLEEHEADHLARTSFTFTILTPDASRCLGCVYINPVRTLIARLSEPPAALTS